MSRTVSNTALQAMLAQETDEIFLTCLTIDHDDLASPILLVNDSTEIVRTAGTFLPFPFTITLPSDSEDTIPTVNLIIDNIDQSIVEVIRSIDTSPNVTMEIILASTPNVIEAGPYTFRWKTSTYDAFSVTSSLGYDDILDEPFPSLTFGPSNFPGMFQL
ncbi:MAG: DUF1833 domain-containing protein [Lutibacter sp.]|uniref:DUF1833 family protein n=1 Tax=Lutibacter sp. TaxID=1925666 RepID=UPI0019FB899A|nr:DUF1833 family protein [Lutibacter sp.]NOR27613.1 DUF1833 domain-containing protein [Lutibacter sp.]